ncbi:SMP-30/gluconolactonase/LRE family protein [Streptomyces tsukubensis]|uniref:Gluconolactonase n=1 Tax=Streptomyces tsukubensis TaxID=83656 RepID=A0A1V4A7W6_9ACTN|nr:SMP-30/gluconolactonase/LRE family protein [Streptomyces tsukubensis]OON78039.1 gluconolactonase [Streptomyces tsukubensis]
MTAVEQVTGPVCAHGEGPVWHPGWGGLRWVDMLAGDVMTLDADGKVGRHHVASVAAVLRPRADGGTVLAVERGFATLPPGSGDAWDGLTEGVVPEPLPEIWDDPTVRMNEGGCDPQGRLWCGSMAYDAAEGLARVHRLDPSGEVTVAEAFGAVTISNGLWWDAEGTHVFYADTPTGRVDVFDHDPETGPTDRRPFARVESPDGLTVDEEGGVWVALWGGGAVHRYGPDGRLDTVIDLPVPQVTSLTFGGPGLDELYITTSQQDTDRETYPQAGSLFLARPGVRGLPVRPFGTA